MSKGLFYSMLMRLPYKERMSVAKWRFQKVREDFYKESRLDIEATKGLRNRETLMERLKVLEDRAHSRRQIIWLVYRQIGERLGKGDSLALSMKPFIPLEEYALLDLAETSTKEDAARRGFELCEMTASARRILSTTTSAQMAYPVILLGYMYGLCALFGGLIYPQVTDVMPLERWSAAGQLLYAFDTYCAQWWWLNLSLIGAVGATYFYGLNRWAGPLRNRLDNAPLMWRNRRDLRAALLIVSLSGLFDSGLTLSAALARVKRNADPWLRWHITRMERRLAAKPEDPMRALETGIFSQLVVDRIADAERRDNFVDAIKSLGRGSLDSVVEAVRRNAKITHYVLLGIAAGLFIALGVGSYAVTGLVGMQSAAGASIGTF
ncbi:type II secretion system protein [Paraburkholderia sp. WP4_3_2]|uniref:type II secretion system protein n=1 Tax=Paraburkholderia sp. WP4_3_2 TaxID=2587162 RepID=UPI0017F765BC|nr:type II secretion system protein [Paraburkholderia sp. WP4_3_2]MBB3261263.1 type II secretory pathway component PulF [Paraburkholderia sp. WP4_3_2]